MSGRLIIAEGGEGAGKSTIFRNLAEILTTEGGDVIVTREPGGTPRAEEVRKFILERKPEENLSPDAQLLMFYAARMQHLDEHVIPSLRSGKTVLCDRFEVSSYVYQIHAQDGNLSLFKMLHAAVAEKLFEATSWKAEYVVFDLDPEIGISRMRQSKLDSGDKVPDVFDDASLDFHHKVRAGLFEAQKHMDDRFVFYTVDASKSPDEVLLDLRRLVKI